jgi:TrmH family RNA methyltransferase
MPRNIPYAYIEQAVAELRVVLVEPKNEGNVGAVARAMKNFSVRDLVLINPPPLGADARQRAMHGVDILETAKVVMDFDSSIKDADLIVGTSGVHTENEKQFARIALRPREFAEKVRLANGRVALLFGREDFGLLDAELRRCDVLVTIPAAEEYQILNLSHAVTIILYELFIANAPTKARRAMSATENERLHLALSDLLEVTDYPIHKRPRTKIMVRRMLGRAVPSKWEFHALMGVFQRATKRIRRLEGKP